MISRARKMMTTQRALKKLGSRRPGLAWSSCAVWAAPPLGWAGARVSAARAAGWAVRKRSKVRAQRSRWGMGVLGVRGLGFRVWGSGFRAERVKAPAGVAARRARAGL